MPVQFTLSRKRVGVSAQVLVRFYCGSLNQRAHTGIYVPVSAWNESEGRCNINRRYNTPENEQARKAQAELDELADNILIAYTRDKRSGISDGWLRDVVCGKSNSVPLVDSIPAYCSARNVAPATRAKMSSFAQILRAFDKQRRKPMYKDDITKADLDAFAAFVRLGRGQNSVACRMRQLRTLVYWNGKPTPNPFDGYLMPVETYADPIYLTREERDALAAYSLQGRLAVIRDIFIFQCHVGCRVSDMLRLTSRNIADGYLIYTPQKTAKERAQTIEVPLTQTALALIEKYRGVDVRGRLLPFISEQRYNEYIKQIARACKLDRPVMVLDTHTLITQPRPLYSVITSHTARKTFAQNAYAVTRDKRLVASMTGHSENSQAFNRYSVVSRDVKSSIVDML